MKKNRFRNQDNAVGNCEKSLRDHEKYLEGGFGIRIKNLKLNGEGRE